MPYLEILSLVFYLAILFVNVQVGLTITPSVVNNPGFNGHGLNPNNLNGFNPNPTIPHDVNMGGDMSAAIDRLSGAFSCVVIQGEVASSSLDRRPFTTLALRITTSSLRMTTPDSLPMAL